MLYLPALLVRKAAAESDPALAQGARGARKLLVTDLYAAKECEASAIEWLPPQGDGKCPVQVMANAEVAVFNQFAFQDRHYHKKGTEIYIVIDGVMAIEVQGNDYLLSSGDMIVVNPGAVHEVKAGNSKFLCRVVTLNCGGVQDRFTAEPAIAGS